MKAMKMNQKKQIIIDSGFIQLHRKLLDWEWYTDTNTKSLFIHILLKANHTGKNWRGIDIKRGSFVTSVNKLSLETGLSVKNVRTALSHLEQTNEVARSTSSINTTITVLNYDNYQSGGKVVASELANKGQTRGKVVATTNNYNNDNNENNKDILDKKDFISFWNEIANKTSLPTLKALTDDRVKHIKARCKDYNLSIEEFKSELESKILSSKFLSNQTDWNKLSFDWIVKPNNFVKVIEGKYQDSKNSSQEKEYGVDYEMLEKLRGNK